MLKSSLFILFCETYADFHQIATFILQLAVYSRHTFCFWTSLIRVEHCFMIPLIRLCYTLSWSRYQNVVPLVQLGCKGNIKSSCFHMFIAMILCFLKQYHAGLEEVIHIVLAP